jgi:hypothetical protein
MSMSVWQSLTWMATRSSTSWEARTTVPEFGGLKFDEELVDPRYSFSRAAAGLLLKDGARPQIVFVIGDGAWPIISYERVKRSWIARKLADHQFGHNLQVADFDGDGYIFCAEQRLNGANPELKAYIPYHDGKGNFKKTVVAEGIDFHESKVVDLDDDGRPDIVSKPYNYGTPRVDIFINLGRRETHNDQTQRSDCRTRGGRIQFAAVGNGECRQDRCWS